MSAPQPNMSFDGSQFSGSNASAGTSNSVALEQLSAQPEFVDCPICGKHAQTVVKGRGPKMYKFMVVMS